MKAAEWRFFELAEQDIPFFTGSVSEAEKAQEENYWKGLARQWWAEADAYEEAVLERAWDAQERAFYGEWEEQAFREEIEEEATYDCFLRAGEEILAHIRGQDRVLWDKEEEEEEGGEVCSLDTVPPKPRDRRLRRKKDALHRGKCERGESPFFQTAWLKRRAAKGVRRSPCVPSRGGFKKVASFYAL